MQPPNRPWESGPLNRIAPSVNNLGRRLVVPGGSPFLHSSSPNTPLRGVNSPALLGTSSPNIPSSGNGPLLQTTSNSQNPPPLPRRMQGQSNASVTSGLRSRMPSSYSSSPYGAMTGGYGSYGGYGGYGAYGGYGGYGGLSSYGLGGYGGFNSYPGYGMNRLTSQNPNDPESRFVQLAEESSRPAFQSIESLVQAFHSVSMMLDSTFNAVYTSFRAVLGVAENFGRLRSLLGQFFSSIALFRAFMWLYKKVLFVLGLRRENPSQDQLWQAAVQSAGEDLATATGRPRSSWPILMFMGIVFSGPYLIFKLISSLSSSPDGNEIASTHSTWDPERVPGTTAIAMFPFSARVEDELTFFPGQRLMIAPAAFQRRELQGWLLARVEGNPQLGLVPFNYLSAAPSPSGAYGPEIRREQVPTSNLPKPTTVTVPAPLGDEPHDGPSVEPIPAFCDEPNEIAQ